MNLNENLKIWISTGLKTYTYHTTRKGFMKTYEFINTTYPDWEQIRVYTKKENTELKRYFKFENRIETPQSIYDF